MDSEFPLKDGITADNLPPGWLTVQDQHHADCKVFTVNRRTCRHPKDSRQGDFYIIQAYDWVVALAHTREGRYVMVNQYRFGAAENFWEFPAGCIDPGENPIDAALRELGEETGYTGENARLIGACRPNPALQNNWCYFVLVENAHKVSDAAPDGFEEFSVAEFSLASIEQALAKAHLTHGLVGNAVLYLHIHQKNSS